MSDLIYFAIGASVLPLFDVVFAKSRKIIRYPVYIGFWIGIWAEFFVSVVIP